MMIKRDYYLKQLIRKKDNGRVKIITGIRRCGKSYLLFKLYREYLLSKGVKENQIISIALDEIENIEYRNPFKLNEYIKDKAKNKNKKYYIFIDEIQLSETIKNPYIENSENNITFVDVLLGLMKIENLDIYVTGSNSKMLSSDILTQFRDRGDEIHVNPLSFSEIYDLYEDKVQAFQDYAIYGGMPYIFSLESDEEKSKYLKDLFYETYLKDILERHKIQNENEIFETLLDFVSSAIGSLTNPNKLAKRFLSEKKIKISSLTISKYLAYFEEAYLLYCAKRYDVKGARYFSTPVKYYFADVGLRNARLNFRQVEETHIMENIIYNDLRRRGYNVDVGVVEHEVNKDGARKKIQLEVDFVVNKGHRRYYIQSALSVADKEKKEQETASLKKIGDSFKKIIVVKDKIVPRHDNTGILYIGLEQFLLQETSSDLDIL
ncbi:MULTISPECIES: ATP-binding protein [unclassified Treponema]|uniref:ATP-binding protein n=1 Tax=unclassified Treponema TaxID=2638727 RepID=UPI0020A6007C|nr:MULTISPECIES: ATP-binding protein [unclassified Treponema]UTC66624.1 ATP-binding protein [Treponema sp. OMZ 789]UTC69356.1 ATP-binding protein [Treponema sp. OMZ 790]UTC72071.1 ATP-binding protein [Treponema sp. OMZ 791]